MLGVASAALWAAGCARPEPSADPISRWELDETSSAEGVFEDRGPAHVLMIHAGTWTDLTTGSLVEGIGGTSAYTDGSAYATLPADKPAHDLSALTISFYYQRNSAAAKHILLAGGNGSQVGDFSIEVLANGRLRGWHTGQDGVLRFFEGTNGISGTNLQVGTAHRIDLSLGSEGARIYLDGAELSGATITTNLNGWNNARVKYLGRWIDGVQAPADGAFDRLRIWNRQLLNAEIADLEPAISTTLAQDPFPLNYTGPIIVVPNVSGSSAYVNRGRPSNTLFDARGKTLTVHPSAGSCADIVSSNDSIFWFGGKVAMPTSFADIAWSDFYHGSPSYQSRAILCGPSNTAAEPLGDNVRLEAIRGDNTWDMLKPHKTRNWVITGCYSTHCHDDFVENDNFESGTIEDCLVDGTYVFYSSRQGGFYGDPTSRIVTIRNCIVRLKSFPIDKGASTPQGTGQFFKCHGGLEGQSGIGTNFVPLRLYDNIFLAEDQRYGESGGASNQDLLGMPSPSLGLLDDASGNTVIWTGGGTFPGGIPASGFTLSTNRAIFENARDAWLANHPWVNQVPSVRPG